MADLPSSQFIDLFWPNYTAISIVLGELSEEDYAERWPDLLPRAVRRPGRYCPPVRFEWKVGIAAFMHRGDLRLTRDEDLIWNHLMMVASGNKVRQTRNARP